MHIWGWFKDLALAGKADSFLEIEAYARVMRVEMTPADVVLIRRLARAAKDFAEKQPRPEIPDDVSTERPEFRELVSASDSAAVKQLTAGWGNRIKVKREPPPNG